MSVRSLLTSRGAAWAGGTLLLLVAAVALFLFTGATASKPSRAQAPSSDDISYGPADARLAVIEYSDFRCPFCAEYAPIMAQLRQEFGDRVRFVFRFFPLENHQHAMASAEAAYAASLQDKFFEMHDLLFERQAEWSESADPRSYFDGYAESLGLDLDRFRVDSDASATAGFIRTQHAEGTEAGVTHTPWFVIGDSVVLPRSVDEFERLIEAAL